MQTSNAAVTNTLRVEFSTVAALLRHLGIEHATASRQRDALTAWLDRNTPTFALRTALRRNGYGLLLGRAARPRR